MLSEVIRFPSFLNKGKGVLWEKNMQRRPFILTPDLWICFSNRFGEHRQIEGQCYSIVQNQTYLRLRSYYNLCVLLGNL